MGTVSLWVLWGLWDGSAGAMDGSGLLPYVSTKRLIEASVEIVGTRGLWTGSYLFFSFFFFGFWLLAFGSRRVWNL